MARLMLLVLTKDWLEEPDFKEGKYGIAEAADVDGACGGDCRALDNRDLEPNTHTGSAGLHGWWQRMTV